MAFYKSTKDAISAESQWIKARFDEVMYIMALRMYNTTQAEKFPERTLAIIDTEHEKSHGAGNYAYITLTTIKFVNGGFEVHSEYLNTLSNLTNNHHFKYSQISPSMFADMFYCARKLNYQAFQYFMNIIEHSDEDAYYLPNLNCMLGIRYVGAQ